jgi:hypothetical protein
MKLLPNHALVSITAGSTTCLPVPVAHTRDELVTRPQTNIWERVRMKLRHLSPLPSFENITFSLTQEEILEDLGYNRD